MSVSKLGQRNQVTIPQKLVKALHLQPGDIFEIRREGVNIVLVPKKIIPAEQAWFWSKAWQEKEKEADEDIRSGRVSEPFENADQLINHLRKQKNED